MDLLPYLKSVLEQDRSKDVYMVALRDGDGKLIGYYEKHEYRDRETMELYGFKP